MLHVSQLIVLCLLAATTVAVPSRSHDSSLKNKRPAYLQECDNLAAFKPYQKQIRGLQDQVDRIVKYTTDGPGSNSAYNELALFCDTFGPRLSGTKALESAIDYLRDKMRDESKLRVTEETAMIPHWEVVSQSCEISSPVQHTMSILTLGNSTSTNGTLEADVVVVHNFNQLDEVGEAGGIKGKIVVFNYQFTKYSESVIYRTTGALRASKYGAVAALIRSVTGFSINSPHAGQGSKSIPTVAITVEDANLIERWVKRGKTVKIKLNVQTKHYEDVKSRNLIGDIKGTSNPEDVVFVSGHMDSWYNTAGAMDDGGGMMISYKALDTLKRLNLTAKRTMRVILWTAEEPGLVGARQYFLNHRNELNKFKAVIESDAGTFLPLGLSFKNFGPIGQCILQETLFVAGTSVSELEVNSKYEGSDIEHFTDVGVPGLSLLNENSHYFDFHHTSGDTMDVEDPISLNRATGLFAATVFVLANLDADFRQ